MGDWEDMCEEFNLPFDSDTGDVVDFFTQYDDIDSRNQNSKNTCEETKIFKNLEEVKKYSMANPNCSFVRNQNGFGFVLKGTNNPVSSNNSKTKLYQIKKFKNEIKSMKPDEPYCAGINSFWYLTSNDQRARRGFLKVDLVILNQVLDQFNLQELKFLLLPYLNRALYEEQRTLNYLEKKSKGGRRWFTERLKLDEVIADIKLMIQEVKKRI